MPDHPHLLLRLGTLGNLSSLIGGIKARSTKAVQRAASLPGPVWAKGYHDRALRRDDELKAVARYIVENPVRARLVRRCGDYPFWDAVWLSI